MSDFQKKPDDWVNNPHEGPEELIFNGSFAFKAEPLRDKDGNAIRHIDPDCRIEHRIRTARRSYIMSAQRAGLDVKPETEEPFVWRAQPQEDVRCLYGPEEYDPQVPCISQIEGFEHGHTWVDFTRPIDFYVTAGHDKESGFYYQMQNYDLRICVTDDSLRGVGVLLVERLKQLWDGANSSPRQDGPYIDMLRELMVPHKD